MKFITIRYEGMAPYTDRTALRNAWEPGDEKPVSERDAKQLLGYLEFKRVDDPAKKPAKATKAAGTSADTDAAAAQAEALALAQQAQAEVLEREKNEKRATEETLLEVSRMTKGALADYAKQNYGVNLDTKAKADDLRNQVTALVQGGLA